MNRNFSIFLLIFLIVFATSIDSFPHIVSDVEKRDGGDDFGKLEQCPGEFSFKFLNVTYTPKKFVPGENVTRFITWQNTETIEKGTFLNFMVFHDKDLIVSVRGNFCIIIKGLTNLSCPIAPGTHKMEFT